MLCKKHVKSYLAKRGYFRRDFAISGTISFAFNPISIQVTKEERDFALSGTV
jgi:hypothetical protein